MMFMTAKIDRRKTAIVISAVIVAIAALILLFHETSTPTASAGAANNDGRVAFLKSFGWDVTTSPKQSGQVRIPAQSSEVFDRYNALQKSQGYDLTGYAGKTVMRYVYQINNYPSATEPVYATLLVYNDQVIGGDVTNTAAKGVIQGFRMPASAVQPTVPTTPAPSAPTE